MMTERNYNRLQMLKCFVLCIITVGISFIISGKTVYAKLDVSGDTSLLKISKCSKNFDGTKDVVLWLDPVNTQNVTIYAHYSDTDEKILLKTEKSTSLFGLFVKSFDKSGEIILRKEKVISSYYESYGIRKENPYFGRLSLTISNGKTSAKIVLKYDLTKIKNQEYSITYDSNGGSSIEKQMVRFLGKFPNIEPTRKGYIFTGWCNKNEDGRLIYIGSDPYYETDVGEWSHIYCDMTVVADWEAISYNIKFNGNGATSGSMNQMSKIAYDSRITLKKNQFKKNGYVFKGWSTSPNGNVKYVDNQNVEGLSARKGKTIILYAVWSKKESINKGKIYGCIIAGANTKNESTVAEANDFYSKITSNKIQNYSLNKKNVKKYINNSRKPSITQIDNWIKSSFVNTTDNDLSYVCYFGHGVYDGAIYEKNGKEIGLGIYVSDSKKGNVYSYKAFINTLTKNIKGKIVLITNACYSGGFVDSVKKSDASKRIVVFASSAVNQTSVGDKKGNIKIKEGDYIGAFWEYMNPFAKEYMLYSYIAIDGLTKTSGYSKMDLNKDGKIYGEEYGNYINKRIQTFDKSFRAPYFLGFNDIPIFQW